MKALCLLLAAVVLSGSAAAQDCAKTVKKLESQGFSGVILTPTGESTNVCAVGIADQRSDTPVSPETRFRIGYLTEYFTAVPIYQLIEQGNFDLETPIDVLMPQLRNQPLDGITVAHLLTHTSGLADSDSLLMERKTPITMVRAILKDTKNHAPVGTYNPSKVNYLILGLLAQKYMMKPWQYVVEDELVRSLGLQNTDEHERGQLIDGLAVGYLCEKDCIPETAYCVGNLNSAGCMYSTADDFWKVYTAFNDGTYFDAQLIDDTDALGQGWDAAFPGMRTRTSSIQGFQAHVQPGLLVLSNNNRSMDGWLKKWTD